MVIQSMTTTTPDQQEESLAQIEALAAAGCPLVRLAVPSLAAAEALGPLRAAMRTRGLSVPLIADVHFNPRAAYEAVRHVAKIRINPGNFARDSEQARMLLVPLLDLLRHHGVALRIGVNHGSLAPQIADAYGHGPRGMVASALEYLRICREVGFEDVVVALKASNPVLMVEANRLLVMQLRDEQMDYPIHLGVTEAGEGAEGILRATIGIATLLREGIGDTLRVSLTGNPVDEIPVCQDILEALRAREEPPTRLSRSPGRVRHAHRTGPANQAGQAEQARQVDQTGRAGETGRAGRTGAERVSQTTRAGRTAGGRTVGGRTAGGRTAVPALAPSPPESTNQSHAQAWRQLRVGGREPPRVEARVDLDLPSDPAAGLPTVRAAVRNDRFRPESWVASIGRLRSDREASHAQRALALLRECIGSAPLWAEVTDVPTLARICQWSPSVSAAIDGFVLRVKDRLETDSESAPMAVMAAEREQEAWIGLLASVQPRLAIRFHWDIAGEDTALTRRIRPVRPDRLDRLGRWASTIRGHGVAFAGVTVSGPGTGDALLMTATLPELRCSRGRRPILGAALPASPVAMGMELGQVLLSGDLDLISTAVDRVELAYGLLQASRRRMSRTEFVSCPGCGRLGYDLPAAASRIKARFGHLRDVKIAIMGCSVNGPGEMADADFGYVGAVAGKVDLYVGRARVDRGLSPMEAEDRLEALLREHRRWQPKPD